MRVLARRRDEAGAVTGHGARGVVSRPGLFGRLAEAGRVAVVPASAGSGKTVLLRSWIGEAALAGQAMERALDLAEPDGAPLLFALHPAPGLLERHARHGTAHAALLAGIRSLLTGKTPAPPPAGPQPPTEPLTDSELRVLRYLPTSLPASEIAGQLHLSVNTVKTHMRHLYVKLGAHRRREAVERARALGLLAPSPPRR